jgi:PAS domain S-box-containing protein
MDRPNPLARILIVEDESIVAMDLAGQLRDLGHEVVGIADNAEDALRLAARCRPDLTLLDVRLKGPRDGVQVADALARQHDAAVLYLTSYSDAETVARAARTGPLGYLTKPFDAQQLHAAIEVALYKASMERRLRASEQRFRSAFEQAPLGMALVASDGQLQEANDALCRLLGVDISSLRGRRIDDLVTPVDEAALPALMDELRHGGGAMVQFEATCRAPGEGPAGVPALVSVSHLPERDAGTCCLFQMLDLTARHEAEQRLAALHAQRARTDAAEMAAAAKSRMLSRMSHELRTPLNAVLGFAQLLAAPGPRRGADTAEYAGHILDAAHHLLALVNDVLDLQELESGRATLRMTPIRLRPCVADTVERLQPLAQEQRIAFSLDIPEHVCVHADEDRLRQVLLQLGSNAVKYNRSGGSVAWRAAAGDDGARVRLWVEDTGAGMSAESLANLFEPFNRLAMAQSRVPGTGLGLLMARTLTHAMNGRLSVTSDLGKGTSVCVDLPLAPPHGA